MSKRLGVLYALISFYFSLIIIGIIAWSVIIFRASTSLSEKILLETLVAIISFTLFFAVSIFAINEAGRIRRK